jgi:hypothetical protein
MKVNIGDVCVGYFVSLHTGMRSLAWNYGKPHAWITLNFYGERDARGCIVLCRDMNDWYAECITEHYQEKTMCI